ncbi:hypothetical protein ACO0SA_000827 [Hanseniaspora valbyensis]
MATFSDIKTAVQDFKENKFLIVMDDDNRENEGDLIIAAQNLTSLQMAFIVKYSSGYICAPLTNKRADQLDLPLLTNFEYKGANDSKATPYTISVDFKEGSTTGISASDRTLTVNKLADENTVTKPEQFIKPGHIVPLRANDDGVLARRGHTEAAVDLCRLAGLSEVGVIGELVKEDDGEMMRLKECSEFGAKHGIKLITVEALAQYIKENGYK